MCLEQKEIEQIVWQVMQREEISFHHRVVYNREESEGQHRSTNGSSSLVNKLDTVLVVRQWGLCWTRSLKTFAALIFLARHSLLSLSWLQPSWRILFFSQNCFSFPLSSHKKDFAVLWMPAANLRTLCVPMWLQPSQPSDAFDTFTSSLTASVLPWVQTPAGTAVSCLEEEELCVLPAVVVHIRSRLNGMLIVLCFRTAPAPPQSHCPPLILGLSS